MGGMLFLRMRIPFSVHFIFCSGGGGIKSEVEVEGGGGGIKSKVGVEGGGSGGIKFGNKSEVEVEEGGGGGIIFEVEVEGGGGGIIFEVEVAVEVSSLKWSGVEWRGFVRMCMDVEVAHAHEI